MMEYNKPEFYVAEFAPNTAVAACEREEAGEELVYNPQEVVCVVQGSEWIFTSTTCNKNDEDGDPMHVVSLDSNSDDYKFYDHQDTNRCNPTQNPNDNDCNQGLEYGLYYIWKGPKANSNGASTSPLQHLLQLANGNSSYDAGNGKYWHAGLAVGSLLQLYSHSY